jgi:hypothetical protein
VSEWIEFRESFTSKFWNKFKIYWLLQRRVRCLFLSWRDE